MKFNIKSKKGFTLIELLVVIGILAVLAAIAIPSVAGLIDRANVSSDNTNANEMTNAIERFASEYELYVQDIGSGVLNPNDLDSTQGRVYNVTGATTRGDITAIEKAQSVKVADVGDEIAIYRDTKYPINNATLQKVVENYMKTSSSTFEPKQSDMHYWYSPDCGVVVVAEPEKTDIELDKYIVSGKDAKGKDITSDSINAQWIDLTLGIVSSGSSIDLSTVNTDLATNTWADIQKIAQSGKAGDYYSVGQTKSLKINSTTYQATIIGINHEGVNGITFIIAKSNGIGTHVMNTGKTNTGGWEASEIRDWLNNDIYNSMSNRDCIKTVTKMTNNIGYQGTTATSTSDKIFLLSPKECGFNCPSWYDKYNTIFNEEGTTYEWFTNGGYVGTQLWFRSACSSSNDGFFHYGSAACGTNSSTSVYYIKPAFVIG